MLVEEIRIVTLPKAENIEDIENIPPIGRSPVRTSILDEELMKKADESASSGKRLLIFGDGEQREVSEPNGLELGVAVRRRPEGAGDGEIDSSGGFPLEIVLFERKGIIPENVPVRRLNLLNGRYFFLGFATDRREPGHPNIFTVTHIGVRNGGGPVNGRSDIQKPVAPAGVN